MRCERSTTAISPNSPTGVAMSQVDSEAPLCGFLTAMVAAFSYRSRHRGSCAATKAAKPAPAPGVANDLAVRAEALDFGLLTPEFLIRRAARVWGCVIFCPRRSRAPSSRARPPTGTRTTGVA